MSGPGVNAAADEFVACVFGVAAKGPVRPSRIVAEVGEVTDCAELIDPYGSLIVRDLGSTNGVYVDGRRVEKATLSMGAEVRIGVLTMRVDLTDDEIDEISEQGTGAVYDLVDTEQVKIIQPEQERYEIG